ncbi:hypothetical protein WMO13_00845 [Ignatzschineria larvae DSM 13226]|uniref:DUF3137 domain-containing protein n=1 Tax=Ignatzschineria larvae DSM 13226 TaxID=1111732 RepID=A0ABZ3BZI2_9GAMM|nr:hypothetical protein [Ignatzschineria larvae]
MAFIAHNRRLKQFINHIDNALQKADTPQALIAVVEEAKSFEGNLAFDQRDFYLYFTLDFLLLIGSTLFYQRTGEGFALFLSFLSIFIAFILGQRFFARRKLLDNLSAKIFYQDFLFDNELTVDHSEYYQLPALLTRLSDFNRGNHSRELRECLRGYYQGQQLTFTYHYYHLHYVDQRTVEKRGNDGEMSQETVLEHFDRYGLILNLQSMSTMTQIAPIVIAANKRLIGLNEGDYAPASLNFRKTLIVYSQTPQQAARFLTPTTVEQLEYFAKHYQKIALEVNEEQELCFSFDDNDLLKVPQQYDLSNPGQFIAELSGKSTALKLERTLKDLETILCENDHNFNVIDPSQANDSSTQS